MTLTQLFCDEVKTLVKDASSDVDARAIVRRKPFVITENEVVERIIHLEVDGDLAGLQSGQFNAVIRNDSHVVGILRLKQSVNGTSIPFVGDIVGATHADISALTENIRVKIIKVQKDCILLDREININARATIRLMDLERAKKFTNAKCRCCSQIKVVPLFHGVPGYCKECNEEIIKPRKAELGSYLQGLLNSGMYYEEDHTARTFGKTQIDSFSRVKGRVIVNVGTQEIMVRQNYDTGEFYEILDTKSYGTTMEFDGKVYHANGKTYRLKVMEWAKGLATKMKELRVDRNLFKEGKVFSGTFIETECYGDQTLLHMRRMFNIAKAKLMMDKRIYNEKDAIECVEKAEIIMNQPDCSRKLHMIISQQLHYASMKLNIAHNLESEIAQKIVGIMTSIQVGLDNTGVAHGE